MISMVLPASAIMYASGSTDNSDALDSEFSENRFASDSGSTDNSDALDSESTEDNSDSSPSDFLPDNTDSS